MSAIHRSVGPHWGQVERRCSALTGVARSASEGRGREDKRDSNIPFACTNMGRFKRFDLSPATVPATLARELDAAGMQYAGHPYGSLCVSLLRRRWPAWWTSAGEPRSIEGQAGHKQARRRKKEGAKAG